MAAKKDPAIVEAFKAALDRSGLVKPGETVLVAFSGGPDSTALLSLFLAVRRELRLKLALAHFNHRLRPEAKQDEAFARATAKRLRLPIVVGSKDVEAHARRRKMNLEEAGRELRYAFLRDAAKKLGAARIATGHTADDQAETVLMRILRGTGPRGLGGIRPRAENGVIRPLLGIERKDLARWLAARRLDFRTDESNFDLRFFRNRVRHEALPLLRRIEPRVVAHLGRLAHILQDEEDARDGKPPSAPAADEAGLIPPLKGRPAGRTLDARALALQPRALARRAVRSFLGRVRGTLCGVSFAAVESVLDLADGKKTTLPGGLMLERSRGMIAVASPRLRKTGFFYVWDGRGALEVKAAGLRLRGRLLGFVGAYPAPFDDRVRAFLDADKMAFPLIVRNRMEGDRYRPLGAPGSKKLKEILRAKRIPLRDRDRLPVILAGAKAAARRATDDLEIAWVPGLPVADAFKVRTRTRRIFWIERTG
jgi:tRNA(Ile)-lysidine synthase